MRKGEREGKAVRLPLYAQKQLRPMRGSWPRRKPHLHELSNTRSTTKSSNCQANNIKLVYLSTSTALGMTNYDITIALERRDGGGVGGDLVETETVLLGRQTKAQLKGMPGFCKSKWMVQYDHQHPNLDGVGTGQQERAKPVAALTTGLVSELNPNQWPTYEINRKVTDLGCGRSMQEGPEHQVSMTL
ncbi:hypothetical protein AALO_G00136650 [Alosa alosa]|uniref:Uncharacterized protein n=1 Tax=Alosa alosa TaxID=278164 RepID=A0AAV6GIB6_9TELE|nr:hypothetical protein AALO_G00136650 [Alosa alosa]